MSGLRWWQLGAASAGVSVAMLGLSTLATDLGVAAADTAEASETTSESPSADESSDNEDTGTEDAEADHDDDKPDDDDDEPDEDESEPEADSVAVETDVTEDTDETEETESVESDRPWATQQTPSNKRDPIENLARGFVATLPKSVRQSLFNQAPTVGATVITGGVAGDAINGHVEAVDPEGDSVVYRVSKKPTAGTVVIGADGSWTYVPSAGFSGADTFVIVADDTGAHINLLDLFWASGTRSSVLVNLGAVNFDFTYTTGAEHWTPERRAELDSAARSFADNIIVKKAVTLDYEVTGWDSRNTAILATASSGLAVTENPFLETWVQNKLRTGVDPNGAAADGLITWNFAYPWALGTSVGANELDFSTVAMHELMHSFGFISMVQGPGDNTGRYWTVYDSFLVDSSGARAIGSDLTWRRELDPNLTGGNGGLFYAGPNAVAVHGGLVPLFAEDPWTASNVTHVDDDTIDDLMNPGIDRGPGDDALSPLMLAIMQDLGYTVVRRTG